MKTGMTLENLARQLMTQVELREDYLVPQDQLSFELAGKAQVLGYQTASGAKQSVMTEWAARQMWQRLDVPAKYWQRLREDHRDLLVETGKTLLGETDAPRLVRTTGGTIARAFLSNRYRPLDNYELLEAALPVLKEAGAEVKSCDVDATRLYLKAVFPKTTAEVKQGDAVQSGIVMWNSEVGDGALTIQPLLYRLVCENGMVMADKAFKDYRVRKVHTGSENEAAVARLYSASTKQMADQAFWAQCSDLIHAAADMETLEELLAPARAAAGKQMEADVVTVAKNFTDYAQLTEAQGDGVLAALAAGDNGITDQTLWGLANAVTRYAQQVESYRESTELEALGCSVMMMGDAKWKQMQKPREAVAA